MHCRRSSYVMIVALSATQVLGPATLWAVEERGIRIVESRRMVIAALDGAALTVQKGPEIRAGQFREVVNVGERLTTGERTMAEVLIGTRAVVTLGTNTTLQMVSVSDDQAVIQVNQGLVRVAAAPSRLGPQGLVTVQTPTGQVHTRGGIVRVRVESPLGKAEQRQNGNAQAYRASYTPERLAAAASPRGEIVHVDEGLAEILGVGGKPMTLQAGQSVTLQAGQPGIIGEGTKQDLMRLGVVAILTHSQTPKEGRDYLVALQVNQATQLGKALTGAAETGADEKGLAGNKKNDTKNVINGATGGVTLVSNSNSNPNNPNPGNPGPRPGGIGNPFSSGGFFSGTGGTTDSYSGSGTLDDLGGDGKNDAAVVGSTDLVVKGGTGLLLFTDRPGATDRIVDDITGELVGGHKLGKFTARKELILMDGGNKNEAAHQGKAPISTLVARAIVKGDLGYGGSKNGDNVSLPLHWQLSGIGGDGEEINGENDPENAKVVLIKAPTEKANRDIVDIKAVLFINGKDVFTNQSLSSDICDPETCDAYGTKESILGDFSSRVDGKPYIHNISYVDGVISARSPTMGNRFVTLSGGVVLDKQTTVSLGETSATNAYFANKSGLNNLGATTLNGSLLSVLASKIGGFNPAFVKVQDRLLGVLGGSSIQGTSGKKTALLSVLDSRVIGPEAKDFSQRENGRKAGEIAPVLEFDGSGQTSRSATKATVTSAVVVRATDVPLDGALLSASSPLLAMINASVITNSHFADLAGNNGRQALVASLMPGDALVRLDNAALTVKGNLLNLNNATATVTGYLFSLNNGSTLQISNGSLFSLNGNSSLTLNGNAFGVFGSNTSTLKIDNNLCGAGAACGALVNSAGQAITLQDGTALQVAGVTQNVVLPNNFNAFALPPGATASNAKIDIDANDALFHIDPTSTLTINGTKVK